MIICQDHGGGTNWSGQAATSDFVDSDNRTRIEASPIEWYKFIKLGTQ
jgi:hypothetical protein